MKKILNFIPFLLLFFLIFSVKSYAVTQDLTEDLLTYALKNYSRNSSYRLEIGKVKKIEKGFMLYNIALYPKNNKDLPRIKISTIKLSNITKDENGYHIKQIDFSNFPIYYKGKHIEFYRPHIYDFHLPKEKTKPISWQNLWIKQVSIDLFDDGFLKCNNIILNKHSFSQKNLNDFQSFALKIQNFAYTPRNKIQDVLDSLDYETVNGSFQIYTLWDIKKDILYLKHSDFCLTDIGSFHLKAQFSNFKKTFNSFLNWQEMSNKGLFAYFEDVFIKSFSLKYEEQSFVNRFISSQAAKNRQTNDALINSYIATLPFLGLILNKPEFIYQLTNQLKSFLKAPKSLEFYGESKSNVAALNSLSLNNNNLINWLKKLNLYVKAQTQ